MIIRIVGVPMDLGAGRRGVDMGPSALRIAGLAERLREIGHTVCDDGDIPVKVPESQEMGDKKLKYLPEIVRVATILAHKVEDIMEHKEFPLVLGGDHSIAMGTISGLSNYATKHNLRFGVIWIDAHADMNTVETTPSGNIHGMPLAAVLGEGARELTTIGGDFRKVDPRNAALVGVRDVDTAEKEIVKRTGIAHYTMADIDKYGAHKIINKVLKEFRERVDLLHVSFDIDSVDPTVAAGVGTPAPGGLSYRETHLIMETIADCECMSSLEVAEVNPIFDVKNQSSAFAVQVIASALGKKII
ncbi:MAG TPA: arginase [Candidatus Acidoferrales bacterium]|nr:arginase [Candidatus Acidoferrales bacterium]